MHDTPNQTTPRSQHPMLFMVPLDQLGQSEIQGRYGQRRVSETAGFGNVKNGLLSDDAILPDELILG